MKKARNRRTTLYAMGLLAVILAVMNSAIVQKIRILDNGEALYVQLAPADPRSLMQGDYMRLRYAIEQDYDRKTVRKQQSKAVIVKADTKGIAQFVRLDDGRALASDEKRLRLNTSRYWAQIKPNTFFFQEGHGKHFSQAQYAVFTFAKDNPSAYVLTGLADEHLHIITPPSQ